MPPRDFRRPLLIAALLALGACGSKGPLYLPQPRATTGATSESAPSPAPLATQAQDDNKAAPILVAGAGPSQPHPFLSGNPQ